MEAVLYFGASMTPLAAVGTTRRMGDGEVHLLRRGAAAGTWTPGEGYVLLEDHDAGRALRRLAARAIDVVVVDARAATGVDEATALDFLEKLFPLHSGGVARRERTLVLVDPDARGARVAFAAGTKRVAEVLIAPTPAAVLDRVDDLVGGQARGKVAVCLAGGGIEGLLYELGVLRALARFLPDRPLQELDMFVGISAGGILAALLANGLSPDEIKEGLQRGSPRLDRITRGDLFDPNVRDLGARAVGLARDLVGRGASRSALSALYRALPNGLFAGDRLRRYLARQLARPGMTDNFEDLPRQLLIGATDQDTSEAVVFGEDGWTDAPIHLAVRASCALMPFYAPQKIAGRWYIDGAFTRTTNMRVAVKHGATLSVLVDPLVPIYSRESGYVNARGGLFGAMQGLKSLINGRFDKAVHAIQEMYPQVAFHLFRPEGDEMRALSGSPMKFLFRDEIEDMAYESTLRRIRASFPRIQRDFARHGIAFRDTPVTPTPGEDPFQAGLLAAVA